MEPIPTIVIQDDTSINHWHDGMYSVEVSMKEDLAYVLPW